MAQQSDSRALDKVIVRLPDGLRDRIKVAAAKNNRSMNAEIVAALEEKYPSPVPTKGIEDLLREWAPRVVNEADKKQQAKLIDELNYELGKITKQARVQLYPSDDGWVLGLLWQTSLFDKDVESIIERNRKSFPPVNFKL